MLDPRNLAALAAVVETGSVTRAAERLGCVQSNVSQRVKRLEDVIGEPLLARIDGRMMPTPIGRVVAAEAARVAAALQRAEANVAAARTGWPPLRLGAMQTIAAVRLPRLLSGLRHLAPEAEVIVEPGPTDEVVAALRRGQIDLGFVAGGGEGDDIVATPLWSERLVRIGAAEGDAEEGTLLVFRQGCSYRRLALEETKLRLGRTPKLLEMGTLDGMIGCVGEGLGVALLPLSVIERSAAMERGEIRRVGDTAIDVRVVAIRRRRETPSRTAAALLDLAEADVAA